MDTLFWLGSYLPLVLVLIAAAIFLYSTMELPRLVLFIGIVVVIELPAWLMASGADDCVARTGDPSCVAGPGWGVTFWQIPALTLIYLAWRLLRRPPEK